jgi:hypothetical protein
MNEKEQSILKRFLATIRSATSGLATVIEWQKKKDYVVRPWTAEEDADFLAFCETIDVPPTDPELALAMQDGECDFFNNDPFVGVKLYRA